MAMTKTFSGGTHPPEHKEATEGKPIERMEPPKQLVIPLHQHLGAPAEPVVEVGSTVRRGDLLGRAPRAVSAAIHASMGGTVVEIGPRRGPTGSTVPSIVIDVDPRAQQTWEEGSLAVDLEDLTPDAIRERVSGAGIVGLGGAAFPTHIKLAPPADRPVDTIIINGCECEPYLTCDHRMMVERPADIITGARLIAKAVGAGKIILAVEANKPDAAEQFGQAAQGMHDVEVMVLPTKYPQGAEKMLIKACLGRAVPPRKLPFDVGVVVQNVGTAIAVLEAIALGKPLVERVITITGELVGQPKNLLVPIGTPISTLLEMCGATLNQDSTVIMGGPMTGVAQANLEAPVVKGTSGIVALKARDLVDHLPCVRCARCVDNCPMGLMPADLGVACEAQHWGLADKLYAPDCIECGVCAYVCPSQRPLVAWFKTAKAEIAAKK